MSGGEHDQLTTWIRNWVHFDNMASNFSKQSTTSRKLRDENEDKIINYLKDKKMENAQIQINGAKLSLVQEKCYTGLTVGILETYLHDYFKKKGAMMDETDQIMRFIKQQKTSNFDLKLRLRKTLTTPSVPGPPSGPSGPTPQLK
jgi:hypothetical protein